MEQLPNTYPPEYYGKRSKTFNELDLEDEMIDLIVEAQDINAIRSIASPLIGTRALENVLNRALHTDKDTFFLFVKELVGQVQNILRIASLLIVSSRDIVTLNKLLSIYGADPYLLSYFPELLAGLLEPARTQLESNTIDERTADMARYLIEVLLLNDIRTKTDLVGLLDGARMKIERNSRSRGEIPRPIFIALNQPLLDIITRLRFILTNEGG